MSLTPSEIALSLLVLLLCRIETIVLHKQTIYTQTLNVINIVKMLMKYATPYRNDPIILTGK